LLIAVPRSVRGGQHRDRLHPRYRRARRFVTQGAGSVAEEGFRENCTGLAGFCATDFWRTLCGRSRWMQPGCSEACVGGPRAQIRAAASQSRPCQATPWTQDRRQGRRMTVATRGGDAVESDLRDARHWGIRRGIVRRRSRGAPAGGHPAGGTAIVAGRRWRVASTDVQAPWARCDPRARRLPGRADRPALRCDRGADLPSFWPGRWPARTILRV
jgi:hypothetical protein